MSAARAFSIYYIYDPSDNPMGWGGFDRGGWSESMIQAIDYKTGKIRWTHPWEGNVRTGLVSTAGNVLFAGGPSSDIVALDATNGRALWHSDPERHHHERTDYLRARRPPVRRRGRGRHPLGVRAERTRDEMIQ